MESKTYRMELRGGQYRQGVPWHELTPGTRVLVFPDPHGKGTGTTHGHAQALAVFDTEGGRHIGYLPREYADLLFPAVVAEVAEILGWITWNSGPDNVHLECTISDRREARNA